MSSGLAALAAHRTSLRITEHYTGYGRRHRLHVRDVPPSGPPLRAARQRPEEPQALRHREARHLPSAEAADRRGRGWHVMDGAAVPPLGDSFGIDAGALGEAPQAFSTMLYRSTDCRCRCGTAMQTLAHSASFQSREKTAPSNPGIKHGLHRQTIARVPPNNRRYFIAFLDKSTMRQNGHVTYYTLVSLLKRRCGVDILFVSHVCLLQDALAITLQDAGENQAVSAFSYEAVQAALMQFVPSLIVVDASHPEGTMLVAAVRAQVPKASVIVLAMHERDDEFLAWADIGISGYLGPDTTADDLLSAVRRVGAGEVACPSRLTALLLNRFADHTSERTTRAGIFSLTIREREIAGLLADGMSNKLIARRLNCALPTVKNHVHSILDKWDCRSRGEAAARYRQQIRDDVKPSGGTLVELRASYVSQMGGATVRNGALQHRASAAFSHRVG